MSYRPVIAGTFTPYITDNSLDPNEGQTYGSQNGNYRRIDDLVWFWIDFFFTGAGTLTGANPAFVRGLPFAHGLASPLYTPVNVGHGFGLAITAGEALGAYIFGTSVDYITLLKWDVSGGTSSLTITELSTSSRITLSGCYVTNDA